MDRKLLRAQLKHTLEGTDFQNQGELYTGKVDAQHQEDRNSQIHTSDAKRRTYRVIDGYALDHQTGKKVKFKDVQRGKIHLFYRS